MRKILGLLLLIGACTAGIILAEQQEAAPRASKNSESASSPLDVESYMNALSGARRKLFADAMNNLTAPQLETFWGVYADFEKEKTELAMARVEMVRKFTESFGSASGLSDADVTHAVTDLATLQKKLIDLRTKYFDIFSRRIDVKTAGRFALVDDYVATSVRLEWLNHIPFPGDRKK